MGESSVASRSCSMGAPSANASSAVNTAGSGSYSTSMAASASSAACGLVAATAATAWPLYRALPRARQFALRMPKFRISPGSTSLARSETSYRSAEVATAFTPGRASAFDASMRLIRAWACGLRNSFP